MADLIDVNEELVTVGTFPEPASANVARTVLESAGIPVFVQGENANSLLPLAFEASVQVRASDVAAAKEILASNELDPSTMAEVTDAEIAAENDTL